MTSTSNIVEGLVKDSDGVLQEGVNVTIENTTQSETHDYGDSGFDDLQTNAQGEWSANLGNFTANWVLGDAIRYSASGTAGSDSENSTVTSGGRTNLNLVLVSRDVAAAGDAIDKTGESVDLYTRNINDATYGSNYGDILTDFYEATTTTASIQIAEDEEVLMPWGSLKQGEALGFFKVRTTVKSGDKIRVPATSGSWWTIMNKPVLYRYKGEPHHYEARLARVSDDTVSIGIATSGTTVTFLLNSTRVAGSTLSGADGATGRVLVVATSSKASNVEVYLQGPRVDTSKYSAVFNATNITITFTNQAVFNSQWLVVDYAT